MPEYRIYVGDEFVGKVNARSEKRAVLLAHERFDTIYGWDDDVVLTARLSEHQTERRKLPPLDRSQVRPQLSMRLRRRIRRTNPVG